MKYSPFAAYNPRYLINLPVFKRQLDLALMLKKFSQDQKTPDSAVISQDIAEKIIAMYEGEDHHGFKTWYNTEESRKNGDHLWTDFVVQTGSYSQGLTGPNSDVDLKVVLNPPIWVVRPDLIVDNIHTADNNITMYSARKWRELLFRGDYTAVETMAIDESRKSTDLFTCQDYCHVSPIDYVTHDYFFSCLGFVRSQIDKAKNNVLAQIASGAFNPNANFDDFVTVRVTENFEKCLPKKEFTLGEFLTLLRTKHPSFASESNSETRKFFKTAVLSDSKTYLLPKEVDLDVECGIYRDDPMTTGGNIMQPKPNLSKEQEEKLRLHFAHATIEVDRKRFKQHLVLLKALQETKKDPETLRVGYAPKAMCHALRSATMCVEALTAAAATGEPEWLNVDRTGKPDFDTLMKVKYPPREDYFTLEEVVEMTTRLSDELQRLIVEDKVYPQHLPEEIKERVDANISSINLMKLQWGFFIPGVIGDAELNTMAVNSVHIRQVYNYTDPLN